MSTTRLTVKRLASLRATGAQTDYFDAAANVPGFGIRVSAAGHRVWFLMYREPNGRQVRHKVGTHPPMDLHAARKTARAVLLGVQVNDADSTAAKRARRSAGSFDKLADRFIENYAKPHKRSWREDARQIRSMCLPRWKGRTAADITRADVRDLLGAVAKSRGGITANRLRALLSKLFRWAVSKDYIPANPASDLPRLAKEVSRARVLSDDEIRTLWKRLDDATAGDALPAGVALWLRLRLLTGQRGGPVARMKWVDVDFERKVWEIPAADMKSANEHVVPLSPQVITLLKERRKTIADGATYVLEGERSRRQRLGVTGAIGMEDFKPDDLRRTAATGMARAGVQRFIVARVLGHADRSVTGVHDRHEYLTEKRWALDTWARRLAAILEAKDTGTAHATRGPTRTRSRLQLDVPPRQKEKSRA
jgi:integrase